MEPCAEIGGEARVAKTYNQTIEKSRRHEIMSGKDLEVFLGAGLSVLCGN